MLDSILWAFVVIIILFIALVTLGMLICAVELVFRVICERLKLIWNRQ